MAEYSANAVQIVNPGESVVFTNSPIPCYKNLILHRDETGNFLLRGYAPNYYSGCGCGCRGNNSVSFLVNFGCNVSIPEGGVAGEISLALAVDGTTVPTSSMIVTPAAVNEYWNVHTAIFVPVWKGCCETVTVRNTSTVPIQVQNANIIFSRPDLYITR